MRRWLRETWELWYWAMFCPSLLQQRMNDWSSRKDEDGNIDFNDMLLFSINWRFIWQFLCLVGLFSLPLVSFLTSAPTLLDWWLLPITLSVACGTAILFLPVAIHSPLIISFFYRIENQAFRKAMQTSWVEIVNILAPWKQLIPGLSIGALLIGLTITWISKSIDQQNLVLAKRLFVIGPTLVTAIFAWLGTQSLILTSLISIFSNVFLFFLVRQNQNEDQLEFAIWLSNIFAFVTAFNVFLVVGVGIGLFYRHSAVRNITGVDTFRGITEIAIFIFLLWMPLFASLGSVRLIQNIVGNLVNIFSDAIAIANAVVAIVAVFFAIVSATSAMVGVSSIAAVFVQLSLINLLIVTAVLAFSLSYAQQRWLGLITSAVLMALGFENLGGQVIWILPVTLSFYYRFIPEYVLFAPIPMSQGLNVFTNIPFQNLSAKDFDRWLQRLPPYSSELLWLPLPGHAQLLAKVFQHNSTLGLDALARMQASSLPGFTRTVQQALPDVIADQLMEIRDVTQLQTIVSEPENVAPNRVIQTILPKQFEITQTFTQHFEPSPIPKELTSVFPRLQDIAEDVTSALQSDNIALRERGLERVLNQLNLLKTQLPGLGLKAKGIQRWQSVINRWQNLIELELADQQKLSQGELLNPFQYGNPLKLRQATLFKGRQGFADNLVRLLLDRNRPTIVLHGPRRCGKTSFLNNLPRLLPSDWIPIFVDMQSAAATADEIGFLRNLARAIRRDGRSLGVKIPTEPERAALQAAPYDTFETWLENVLDEIGERQLLLNLDEFEKIGTAINQGKLSLTLFDELRSLIQHWEQLGFVFSGVQTLEEIGPNWSSYFISVVPVEMLYLEPNEARDLLTNPDPDFALDYAPGLVDDILQLTQCHPNLLQLIGAALVTEANEQHTTTATPAMLEAAIPRAFTLGTSYFTNVWDEFTGNIHNPAEVYAGRVILKALADDIQPATNLDSTAQSALRHMTRYHVLRRENDQYNFEIPLIKRWVRDRAILNEY